MNKTSNEHDTIEMESALPAESERTTTPGFYIFDAQLGRFRLERLQRDESSTG